ncbi:hypothetical protein [Polyangium jinanense]|uniref:Uncharacterized protein n=1 Tax=Polyangium jinanense TaxID=2829994 RepID=A0A9X4AUN0_9BACT|nr:hypothetical protein [Polyangium jinanense]MDC3960571.1 hypothetical protein [Polyangium jinanense]MDC3985433.1 hypothetical protein [Polyangium jinanense]
MSQSNQRGAPLGEAPGYGDLTEGNVGNQGAVDPGRQNVPQDKQDRDEPPGTSEPPLGTNVGGEQSQGATRHVGRDPGKGSQGFGNE